ncbi:MAG: sulfite exporter TauE/SafE family protein [Lachnospiraceae bacterium]|nr:sulfite exporter TauE/SafE family protein [Lachnospiraceae bacterium]MCI9622201.1 sulfite exporter TauE/SafE family protein [Lachnospiraceae bacterium]
MKYIVYFVIAFGATTVGSMTGMGGGVVIKPLLDVLHDFDVETIGGLSAITVFSMAVVSIGKQMLAKTKIPFAQGIPLAVGSVLGGLWGQNMLELVVRVFRVQEQILVIQNVLLGILIFFVWLYMRKKDRIQGRHLSGIPVSIFTGCFLGLSSSFLGIGGGPVNVALLTYLYSMSTKTAAVCSLITILSSQAAKLLTMAAASGFGRLDLSMAPVMVIGAVAGGYTGTVCSRKLSEKEVEKAFHMVQLGVLGTAIFNVIRNL